MNGESIYIHPIVTKKERNLIVYNWLIRCEVSKVLEHNRIGRILFHFESRTHLPCVTSA